MEIKPIIGSYVNPDQGASETQPKAPQIVDKLKRVDTPATSMQEGIQEELKQDVEGAHSTVEKTKSYLDILAENDIDKSKAQAIVDAILTNGFYEEALQVTKAVTVTLRTRGYEDYKRYLRALEYINPKYVEEQNEIQIRYFLAASLVVFKGQAFEHVAPNASEKERESAFDVRMEWISMQNERIINLLASKLSKFDRIVQIVMSEGVVENF